MRPNRLYKKNFRTDKTMTLYFGFEVRGQGRNPAVRVSTTNVHPQKNYFDLQIRWAGPEHLIEFNKYLILFLEDKLDNPLDAVIYRDPLRNAIIRYVQESSKLFSPWSVKAPSGKLIYAGG